MSTVQEIEVAIQNLPPNQLTMVHDWLVDYYEDHLELSEDAKASLARAEQEMAKGKGRIHKSVSR